ncbi:UPF0182 family protein [Bacillota bacterium LX-D]|nr:UPF0182 family protein [Bacillota bacterium LX-D]
MRKNFVGRLFLFLIVLFLFIKVTSGLYVHYQWFKDLGYTQLFLIPIAAKFQIGLLAFLIYFLILSSMGIIAVGVFKKAEKENRPISGKFHWRVINSNADEAENNITPINYQRIYPFLILVSFVLSTILAFSATKSGWMKLLQFKNATSFGLKEFVFNRDVGFYIFQMPFFNFVLNSLNSSLFVIFAISIIFFTVAGLIHVWGNIFRKGSLGIPRSIRRFWSILLAVLFALIGLKKFFSIYEFLNSQAGYVYGAGYTDIHVAIPLAKILALVALLASIASIIYFFRNDHRLILWPIALYLIISGVGAGLQSFIQYNVSNNEFFKEQPYIQQEIKFTRLAYNLNNIQIKDYPGNAALTYKNVQNNQSTMENIRLNDPEPLKTVLSQIQGLRYYYRFHDIDIDRYTLDGKYRQVLLSPREISDEALTEKANTFINLTMRYTHGYGLAATLANEIDESGYAKLIVKDVPPQSSIKGFEIKEPRIYFGELTNDRKYGYVIGNTTAKEFDYPLGENNAENIYRGKTGLAFTPLNKLFLSAYFNTFRFYLAGEITPESKLLMKRNITERVSTLMPYLLYDQDPYLVAAADGKMYWIIDAYTHTNKFPYSSPVGNLNYIRNSVKVVVDAYNGTVNFYVFDEKDPLIKTISKIFPGVFKNRTELPSNLAEHLRYPEDIFNIQSNVLLNFHVTNPSVFYNREDTWDIAKKVVDGNTENIKPYYSIMRLPGEKNSEFVLMLPFTPASRQEQHRNNLIAWLAARNDGEHYGELILYKLPKNVEIQGPLMIESLIDQDTTISSKITLWGQGGSEIIRGNLIAVPIDGGFVYVEPIYIKAARQGTSIPQMQAIVFAIDKKVVLLETKSLDKAVAQFFSQAGLPEQSTQPGETTKPQVVNPKEAILKQIQDLKNKLQELENQVKDL